MTESEQIRRIYELALAARVEAASSDEDNLDPLWHILLDTTLRIQEFAKYQGVTL